MPANTIEHLPNITLGAQLIVELYDCKSEQFDDVAWIEASMNDAAREAKATIVQSVFHKFNPIGISGVVVISESHLAIHTWPEYRYAAVDIFTCGSVLDGYVAAAHLIKVFGAATHHITRVKRGLMSRIENPHSVSKEMIHKSIKQN